jgi:serine protease Do
LAEIQEVFMRKLALLGASFSLVFSGFATQGAELLKEISQTFTEVGEKATPATVSVQAQVPSQTAFLNPFEMFGFAPHFFPQLPQQQPSQTSSGSGFLISEDGYIVTNNHVIKDATKVMISLYDGREYTATVKGSDPSSDLAVLKIEEKDLPFLHFGNSDQIRPGEWVIAIGNPFGLEATLTVGVVSAKKRQDLGIASYEDFIQTDAAINPGNSGGPLLNLKGEVIGVNSAIFTRSGGYMGIGLSISSHLAQNVINQILETGKVKRAYLGIIPQAFDKELAEALGNSVSKSIEGILVADLTKESPAAKGGLCQGDVILEYNGQTAKNVTKFRNDIAMMNPGSPVQLKVLRNGKKLDLNVLLGAKSEEEIVAAEMAQKLGVELSNITSDLASRLGLSNDVNGVVISKVQPGSPSALAGIQPGSVITGVVVSLDNQKAIHNTSDFEEALKELKDRKHIVLIIRHQNYQRYYTVKLS